MKIEEMAYSKGYRVINGKVISPFNKKERKLQIEDSNGYKIYYFNIRTLNNKVRKAYVHKLLSFQKFGQFAFSEGVQTRHLDGNSLNNLDENIDIGTCSENQMDKPKEIRLKSSIIASTQIRKFTDSEIEEIRKYRRRGKSYGEIMAKYLISSKGSLHYILNNNYVTHVTHVTHVN